MQAHRHAAEDSAAQPGRVQSLAARIDVARAARQSQHGRRGGADAFFSLQREHRVAIRGIQPLDGVRNRIDRSEEHTSELQSLMRTSYAVICLKKKTTKNK